MGKNASKRRLSEFSNWWRANRKNVSKHTLRVLAIAVVFGAVGGGAIIALLRLEKWVLHQPTSAPPVEVRVVLADAPSWMPERLKAMLLEDFSAVAKNYLDESLTASVAHKVQQNPWVREVKSVRKYRQSDGFGIVEISADYRQVFATVVSTTGQRNYVDAHGIVLPSHQAPKFALRFADSQSAQPRTEQFIDESDPQYTPWKIHYIEIYGAAEPAPEPGAVWPGQDVAEGLKMVRLLLEKPYNNQIAIVDVRNHNHRLSWDEAPFQLIARIFRQDKPVETQIYIDRFASDSTDYVVTPERALQNLDVYFRQHGILAGNVRYLDLRYDNLHASNS